MSNFWLSFATSRENSPTEIIAMLAKKGCSFLKFARKKVNVPIARNLEIRTAASRAIIKNPFCWITLKSTSVPIDIKNIEVNIIA